MNDFNPPTAARDFDEVRLSIDRIDLSAERMSRTLTRAFAGAITQGRSLEETLKGVALSLSKMALQQALAPLSQSLASALSSLGSAVGGASRVSIPVAPFADGGIVSRPTFFGAGGGLGLMGERGAEAIMPLARGPDGRLGLAMKGAAPAAPIVNVTINTPDAESFRRSQAQVVGALARAVARGRRGS